MLKSHSDTYAKRKKILVICPFPKEVAAGQRLKYEQYFDDWRAAGYDIDISSYMDSAMWDVVYLKGCYKGKIFGVIRGHLRRMRDMFRLHKYDLVYVFMWVTPFGTNIFERLLRFRAQKVVFDVEDNILTDQALPSKYNPNYLLQLLKGPRKARYLIRTADHVITSSPFLNDFCLGINEKKACTYISSSIDTDLFLPVNSYTNDELVTVGWTGTFSSKVYLDLLRDVLVELARRVAYRLIIIGNFDYELEGVDLEVIRWSKEREVEDLQSFDIGIYPLPMNDWVLGKSGLKAIQYMAFGLPVVATKVGTTPLIMEDGVHGILVETDEQWLTALEKLIKNPQMRQAMGEAGRANAVSNFSTYAVSDEYTNILNNLTGSQE